MTANGQRGGNGQKQIVALNYLDIYHLRDVAIEGSEWRTAVHSRTHDNLRPKQEDEEGQKMHRHLSFRAKLSVSVMSKWIVKLL